MYKRFFKRLLDIVLSFFGIIILGIPMLIIAIIIKATSPGPVLFVQERMGIHKTRFNLYKFRTMRIDTPHDVPTHLLENPEQYITKVGKFLRKTSLDELPQIFQIFTGKMSVLGPRPALWNQFDLLEERDKYKANDVRPGLSGWAQVNGRDAVGIEEKAMLDGDYVSNITFKMDWTCFWMTVGTVLKRKGVIEGGTGVLAKQKEKREQEVNAESKKETVLK